MRRRKRIAKGIIKDPKLRGEWVESVFLARGRELGLAVSKPWGDSDSFDFVVGRPGRFVSVQVKSTIAESWGGYACCVRKQNEAYARGSFDFVAAYVIPEDVWYIIPAEKLAGKGCVSLCSESKHAHYEQYREAWRLLQEATAMEETMQSGEGSAEVETGAGFHTTDPTSRPANHPAGAWGLDGGGGELFQALLGAGRGAGAEGE